MQHFGGRFWVLPLAVVLASSEGARIKAVQNVGIIRDLAADRRIPRTPPITLSASRGKSAAHGQPGVARRGCKGSADGHPCEVSLQRHNSHHPRHAEATVTEPIQLEETKHLVAPEFSLWYLILPALSIALVAVLASHLQPPAQAPTGLAAPEDAAPKAPEETPDDAAEEQAQEAKAIAEAAAGVEEPITTVGEILAAVAPHMINGLFSLATEITNIIFMGHTNDPVLLAAVGLGNMVQNMFALSIGFGICKAMEGLANQAHLDGDHRRGVEHLQRCRALSALQLLWMVPLLCFSEALLVALRQDPAVARHAQEYNRASALGLFAVLQFAASGGYLRSRGQVMVPVLVTALTGLLHVCWCALFVVRMELGIAGIGYANAVTWWLSFLLLSFYLRIMRRPPGIDRLNLLWFDRRSLLEWGSAPYTLITVAQTCGEWWFWEVTVFLVGLLGPPLLAAHVATGSFVSVVLLPIFGLHSVAEGLVEDAIDEGKPQKARRSALVCLGLDLALWASFATVILLGRRHIPAIYTGNAYVQEIVASLLCIFAVSGFCDSAQSVMGGIARGLGFMQQANTIYVVSYYGVMIPVACFLAFYWRLGLLGVWYAFAIGTGVAALLYTALLLRADFDALAAEAAAYLEAEERAEREAQEAVHARVAEQHQAAAEARDV